MTVLSRSVSCGDVVSLGRWKDGRSVVMLCLTSYQALVVEASNSRCRKRRIGTKLSLVAEAIVARLR